MPPLYAEYPRPSSRRSEDRRRAGDGHGRQRRRAVSHPAAAREPRHLRRNRAADVRADAGGRSAAEGRARIVARHGACFCPIRCTTASTANIMESVSTGKPAPTRRSACRSSSISRRIPKYSQVFNDAMTALSAPVAGAAIEAYDFSRHRHARRRRRRARRGADVDSEGVPEGARHPRRRRPRRRRREAADCERGVCRTACRPCACDFFKVVPEAATRTS